MSVNNDEFIAEGIDLFAFLVERDGYFCESESKEWFAAISFTRSDSAVRISYGDREIVANVTVARRLPGRPGLTEYGFWEWMEALGIENSPETCVYWVQTHEHLSRFLREAADALRLYLPTILEAGPRITQHIEESREARYQQDLGRQTERDLNSAAIKASRAFWKCEFRQVVHLLEPFVAKLSESERKKFEYAQRKISTGSAFYDDGPVKSSSS